jgi:hypothetical protein
MYEAGCLNMSLADRIQIYVQNVAAPCATHLSTTTTPSSPPAPLCAYLISHLSSAHVHTHYHCSVKLVWP